MEIPSTLCSNVYDFAFCPEPCYERLADLAHMTQSAVKSHNGPADRLQSVGGACR